MKQKIPGLLVLFILALCAWSPWITQDTASLLAETQFNRAWSGIMDGCGVYGDELGAKDFRKSLFGAMITLDYQCGLVASGEPALQTNVYVSFVGITFGYPAP